jgi:two-component system chemotaxis response regulator CheB
MRVVAMGASRGGVSALGRVLRGLPATLPASVVVVQHRHADADGGLVALLQRASALPVSEPDDHDPLRPGRVYVAPAGYHLLVEGEHVALSIDEPVCFARPSIDVLFESVADACGERALAVMLTSSNADGAAGAAILRGLGGCVIVQDPEEAEAPEGPRAVIELAGADEVVSLESVAERIAARCAQLSDNARRAV